jgi:hypothetical protein
VCLIPWSNDDIDAIETAIAGVTHAAAPLGLGRKWPITGRERVDHRLMQSR